MVQTLSNSYREFLMKSYHGLCAAHNRHINDWKIQNHSWYSQFSDKFQGDLNLNDVVQNHGLSCLQCHQTPVRQSVSPYPPLMMEFSSQFETNKSIIPGILLSTIFYPRVNSQSHHWLLLSVQRSDVDSHDNDFTSIILQDTLFSPWIVVSVLNLLQNQTNFVYEEL